MKHTTYAMISGLIFAVVAFVHLLRVIQGWDVTVVGMTLPIGLSWAAFAIAAILAYFGIKLGLQKPHR